MADEFADKLNAVLGNPEAMSQIMSLAQSLSGTAAQPAPQDQPQDMAAEYEEAQPYAEQEQPPSAGGGGDVPDLSALFSMLGGMGGGAQGQPQDAAASPLSLLSGLDPRLLQMAMQLLSGCGGNDQRVALLTALRPFVKKERYAKVDRAIQVARLAGIARTAFQLFQDRGDGNDV